MYTYAIDKPLGPLNPQTSRFDSFEFASFLRTAGYTILGIDDNTGLVSFSNLHYSGSMTPPTTVNGVTSMCLDIPQFPVISIIDRLGEYVVVLGSHRGALDFGLIPSNALIRFDQ